MKQEKIKECCDITKELMMFIMDRCQPKDMTGGEFAMLKMFADTEKNGDKLTVTAVSKKIDISKAAVSQMINNLEKKGWATREADKNDKRRVYISLTEGGRDMVKKQLEYIGKKLMICFDDVTDEELDGALISLSSIAKKIKK